ncbi:MAG: glycerophosphodiester phosphodiesterase family protein [Eubacterium sp.]
MATMEKKKTGIGKKILCIILAIILAFIVGDIISVNWHSNPDNIKTYETDNKYINTTGSPYVSAHRSGGGIEPEESMVAFRNCIENPDFNVDVFEFDLHITKDNVLVLLHDDTLERTTDCEEVLGDAEAAPENYTYDELRQLNIGAKFENENGEMPYADLKGNAVPDDLKIVRVEDILDYLMANGDFDYIIEIKNGGDLGCKGVDILYPILEERGLLNDVIFGTFKEEVSFYVDDNYPNLKRSATINEVLEFYSAALKNDKDFEAKYIALQIPYNMPWRIAANLGTAKMINYAHEHNIAVQYWTINSEKQLAYLSSVGADCIMSDYPDKLYEIIHAE